MPDTTLTQLIDLQTFAEKNNLKVEATVARIYRTFEEHDQKKIPFEQAYVSLLDGSQTIEDMGVQPFENYRPGYLFRYIGRFFYDIDDHERALHYLFLAEKWMPTSPVHAHAYILILNNIQTIFQEQKNYSQGIDYAQKIIDFARKLPQQDAKLLELKKIWTGIATVDMASMLVEQQKLEAGEVLANQGYQMVLEQTHGEATWAEYDVLQVMIAIKLGLKKYDEAQKLLARTDFLRKTLDRDPKISPFKHIRLYQSYAKYHELRGNAAEALRYFNLEKMLADSLDRQNDARKLEKISRRQEAEKYAARLRMVEQERNFQTLLRNVALLFLVLVAGLAWVNLSRLRAKRRLDLANLAAARSELAIFTKNFKEKSELVENLRQEMEQLSARGERSQHLEQLTQATILTDEDWTRFRAVFEKVHPNFIAEQRA